MPATTATRKTAPREETFSLLSETAGTSGGYMAGLGAPEAKP
ncbi:MAG TPA: hypothetical protein V6D17_19730 [Candidatus Obscuribacterales bacterium]